MVETPLPEPAGGVCLLARSGFCFIRRDKGHLTQEFLGTLAEFETTRLCLRRTLVVQLPQRAVQLELLLGEQGQLGEVAAALGFGNQGAQVALAASP